MTKLTAEFGWSLRARGYSDWTIHDHTTNARRFLDALSVPITDTTRSHAEQWLANIASPFQRRKATFALKSFARWLSEESISDDLGQRLRTPKVPTRPMEVAAREDIAALLAVCSGRTFNDRRDAALVAVMACTGCRRSEVERMTFDDLDLDARTVTIPVAKSGHGRVVYLDHYAGRRVARYLRARSDHPTPTCLPSGWRGAGR
jgi:integrase